MPQAAPAPVLFDPARADAATAAAWAALRTRGIVTSPFAALSYAASVGSVYGLAPVGVAMRGGDGAFTAGAIVYIRRRGPYRFGVVPPFTPHTPVLLAEPLAENAVHGGDSPFGALLDALAPTAHAHALHLDPALQDVRPAVWRGWSARPLYTYRLALADTDTLLAGWSSSVRRTFRKAQTAYDVRETRDPGPAVALCAGSYGRHDRDVPGGADRLRRLIDLLAEKGLVRIFTATSSSGDPEAAVVLVHDGDTAYYWIAGSVPGAAMTVLLGVVLPRLHAEGLRTFDFVGANTAPIAEFKRKFGAALVSYYRLTRIRRPELHLLHRFLA